jgi:predicted alpha/beta-fold hydrolase
MNPSVPESERPLHRPKTQHVLNSEQPIDVRKTKQVSPVPEFQPHPLLRSGHAMTIATAFLRRRFHLPPAEKRLFRVDQDSQLLAHCHWQPGKSPDTPVVVILHGLEGSSESNYVMGVADKCWAAGFHAIRLNQRNCGGSELLTPTLYNSGMSADYRTVLAELANADGFSRIFFVGYSMGGNLVTKMAGEFTDAPPPQLHGVCAVCPSMDLSACADALERWDNYLYQRRFVKGLLRRYQNKARLFPRRYTQNSFGPIRSVREFDDAITAPHFGFRDARHYYETSGAKKLLTQIRVPMLLITAKDDPFIPYESFLEAGADKNPAIRFFAPDHGGHCGFISKWPGPERYWAEQRIVEFVRSMN